MASASTTKAKSKAAAVSAPVDAPKDVPAEEHSRAAPRPEPVAKSVAAPATAPAQVSPAAPVQSDTIVDEGPPTVVPKVKPASAKPTPRTGSAPTGEPKGGGIGKWFVPAVILGGLLFYFKSKPDQNELACNAAFEAGNKALLAKDIAGARSQAVVANGVCTGSARSKLQSLQTAIESAESVATACLHSFRAIDGYLDNHKLTSARNALNQLSSTCSAAPDAEEDRKKLSAAVAASQAAQSTLREALDAKNLASAKATYRQLADLNRENEDLAALKNELDKMTADAAAAAETLPVDAAPAAEPAPAQAQPHTSAPAPVHAVAPPSARVVETPRPTLPPPGRKPETDNGASVKAEMAANFLRDAETALAQKKFDAAKTYVESARRMDPSNPRLDSMLQQIRDREHQVLQQESTLR